MTVILFFKKIRTKKTKKIAWIQKISSLNGQIGLIFQLEQLKPICLYAMHRIAQNNNHAYLRECFTKKHEKKSQKRPFRRCSRSKFHFDETKSMPST
jgi:hypothetical protein